MCRWIAWSGAPRFLEELISVPEHSLIRQSRQALAAKTPVNADGFGIAWYGFRPEPCLYKDIHPAWSDPNLQQLAHHARASLFMAHVRASTGAATTYNNSHPFAHGRWAFMHNGQVGGYDRLRKTIDGMIPDELYSNRRGATDSEALFLIALGLGLADDPVGAMAQAVFRLEEMACRRGVAPYALCRLLDRRQPAFCRALRLRPACAQRLLPQRSRWGDGRLGAFGRLPRRLDRAAPGQPAHRRG